MKPYLGSEVLVPLVDNGAMLVNPYVRWIQKNTINIWNGSALTAAPAWSSQAIALSLHATAKLFTLSVPTGLPNGAYYLPVYNSAAPADTDVAVRMKYCQVFDGEFMELYEL